jgi:hypothetical protein
MRGRELCRPALSAAQVKVKRRGDDRKFVARVVSLGAWWGGVGWGVCCWWWGVAGCVGEGGAGGGSGAAVRRAGLGASDAGCRGCAGALRRQAYAATAHLAARPTRPREPPLSARVSGVDCDIAALEVDDPAFWAPLVGRGRAGDEPRRRCPLHRTSL